MAVHESGVPMCVSGSHPKKSGCGGRPDGMATGGILDAICPDGMLVEENFRMQGDVQVEWRWEEFPDTGNVRVEWRREEFQMRWTSVWNDDGGIPDVGYVQVE